MEENPYDGITIREDEQHEEDVYETEDAMAIDDGMISRKSVEGFAKKKGSGRNTNGTGAVGCLNTRFVSPSTKQKR